jgi:anti-sigma B factor antagonist
MRISTETGAGRHAMKLAGRFDAHEVPAFGAAVDALLTDAGCTIRIDMNSVVFVDSSALAELLRAQRAATATGGDLVLVDPADPVRIILELTALDQVLRTEQSAGVRGDG